MITIAVCDDQKTDLNKIERLIKDALSSKSVDSYTIISYEDSTSLLNDIKSRKNIDLLYLDIVISHDSGFTLADKIHNINNKILIIFVSNYPDMIDQSILYQPFLFIRKSRIDYEICGSIHLFLKQYREKYPLCTFNYLRQPLTIDSRDILYMTSHLHELTVYLKEISFVCRDSITQRKRELCTHGFVQSHISCLVNLRYVEQIKSNEIIMQNGESVTLSRTKREEVKAAYLSYLRDH